jgi:hypothetical protein
MKKASLRQADSDIDESTTLLLALGENEALFVDRNLWGVTKASRRYVTQLCHSECGNLDWDDFDQRS